MCIRTGNPGRPCLGSMAPGDYSNSSNKEEKKYSVAEELIKRKQAERDKNTIIENYYYQNSLKEDQ